MDNGACSYRRYINGDDTGFEEIIEIYKDGLILYINTFVGDLVFAEELCEDTFFKLAVKKPHYNGRASFKTWLYTIAKNVTIDALRHRKRHATVPLEEAVSLSAQDVDFEKSVIKDEQKSALLNALSSLKTEYRTVLWLVYFEDFSTKEASVILKKSAHATDMLLHRAKKALKEELERSGFTYENI